jgi:endonuclease/exonuclease/phosphatase family metal-dependent hydrolase
VTGSVRVMSFNLHHGVGPDGRLDLERCAAIVEACAPDLVALQEVDRHLGARSGFVDQPAWLAERLGMAVAFGANIDLGPGDGDTPHRQYGTALLSRHPIRWWRNTPLPAPLGGERRGLLEALVVVDGRPLRALATHLQHDSAAGRAAQVMAVEAVVAASAEPVVLLGDLNAAPHAPELASLDATLVDAWESAGDGPGRTFPSTRPRTRIDYVMSSPDLPALAAAVVPGDASDHLPVVADLALPGA